MRRAVLVLVLALVGLAPSGVRASVWYRCAHDGVLRDACCCPPKARHHAAPPADAAAVRAACCCAVSELAARAPADRDAPPAAAHALPAIAAVAVIAAPPPPAIALETDHARPGAPRGPPAPLFALHCTRLL